MTNPISVNSQYPAASAESAADRYTNGRYAEDNPGWHEADSPWKASQIVHMIRRNHLQCRAITDVGCGAGEVLVQLQKQLQGDICFTGFDISPHAVRIAQAKGNGKLLFREGSQPEGISDLVLLIDVFEHVEDCIGFLRLLRPFGRQFIFHIPLDLSALSVFREWPLMKRRRTVGHLHYFTKSTALATLDDAGYRVQDCFYPEYPRKFGDDSLKTILARRLPEFLVSRIDRDWAVRLFGDHTLMVLAEPRPSLSV
jgi:SAM-dependent methyltransferase